MSQVNFVDYLSTHIWEMIDISSFIRKKNLFAGTKEGNSYAYRVAEGASLEFWVNNDSSFVYDMIELSSRKAPKSNDGYKF